MHTNSENISKIPNGINIAAGNINGRILIYQIKCIQLTLNIFTFVFSLHSS